MKNKITIDWLDGLSFETELNGHKIYLDADEKVGGKNLGPRPKPLMMVALAGCTGMDVASVLKKMRVEYEAFSVDVEGELTEEHPKKYASMKVIYRFRVKYLLSRERYCGVSANYSESFPVDHEIVIE